MAKTNIVKMQIQFRRDTTENWEEYHYIVPAEGEPCFDVDLGTLKIGDGIKTYGELDPIGGGGKSYVSADGQSIVLEDDVFKLAGFDFADVGAQPRKSENGGIEWVVPSIENLDSIQSDVYALQDEVNEIQEALFPPDGLSILSRIESLEDKIDNGNAGFDASEIDAKIDAKINEFATNMSDDDTINTFKELLDYAANHGSELDTIVSDVGDLQDLVGDEPVRDQIAYAIQESAVTGIRVNGELVETVDGVVDIDIAEQMLGVQGSDEIDVSDDGILSIKSVDFKKIAQTDGDFVVFDGGGAPGLA